MSPLAWRGNQPNRISVRAFCNAWCVPVSSTIARTHDTRICGRYRFTPPPAAHADGFTVAAPVRRPSPEMTTFVISAFPRLRRFAPTATARARGASGMAMIAGQLVCHLGGSGVAESCHVVDAESQIYPWRVSLRPARDIDRASSAAARIDRLARRSRQVLGAAWTAHRRAARRALLDGAQVARAAQQQTGGSPRRLRRLVRAARAHTCRT